MCQDFRPRNGERCDDGNPLTHHDTCLAGSCSGLHITCPADIRVHNTNGMQQAVSWNEPRVTYHRGASLSVSSNYESGDVFPVGAWRCPGSCRWMHWMHWMPCARRVTA
jgi:hypothetical protein